MRDNTLRNTSKNGVEQELVLTYPMRIFGLDSGLVNCGGTIEGREGEVTIKIPYKIITARQESW